MNADGERNRAALLDLLQGQHSPLDGDVMAISGYLLVVELVSLSGERGVVRITSDSTGRALPWHTAQGLAAAAAQLDDYDDE